MDPHHENPGILISKNFICYFVIFLTKALQNRFRYVKIPSLTLYKAKNSHNPSVYLWCGCFGFCIDIVLFWKLCYFFCFVSLMIVRISAFEMNS